MRKGNLRYNSLNRYLRRKFGEKIFKVTLDAGLNCPNRDGSRGEGGCIFCNTESGMPLSFNRQKKGIKEQLATGIEYVRARHGASRFISYFQQHSNTYGPAKILERCYREAIDHKDVVGLAVATRPDCIDEETYHILRDISQETYLWVELGLQTANDKTLEFINRGHGTREFIEAAEKFRGLEIPVCAHTIIGLPGESKKDLLETAVFLNRHGVGGIKIHNLHILKDTKLEEIYRGGRVGLLSLEEYSDLVVDTLENLSPEILIHRFNSHSPRHLTVAPEWSINKLAILNRVEEKLEERDSWQGKRLGAHW